MQFIVQQLLNTPAAVAGEEWQLRGLVDGDLHADAAAQQHLYRGLRRAGQRQLRRELSAIHARLYVARPGFWPQKLRLLAIRLRDL